MVQEDTTIFFDDGLKLSVSSNKSVGDAILEKMVVSDNKCPKHDINLVSVFGREPICIECRQEVINDKEKQIHDSVVDEHAKGKTYHMLKRNSIFLDETLKTATFDNYLTNDDETKRNKEKSLVIAGEYHQGANYNTIFTGEPGTGKSHLAMSMLKVVNEHSDPYKKCLFVSIDEVMRKIKDSFNNRDSKYTEQFVVDLLTSADLLVIDDLGAETGAIFSDKTATDFTIKILYAIVNGRMNKPTIFTTNLNSETLAKKYDLKLLSRILRGSTGHQISFKETSDKRISDEF